MKLDTAPYESKMKKSLSVFEEALLPISAGRANPGVLNGITVDYYGAPTARRRPSRRPMPEPWWSLLTMRPF